MQTTQHTAKEKFLPMLWLLMAAVLLVAGKQWGWPLATISSPLFMLHYLRRQPVRRGLAAGWLAQSAAILIVYSGTAIGVFGSNAIYIAVMLLASALLMLPFLADRLLSPCLPPLAATLVFPFARTALEFLAAYNSPYGEWASLSTDFVNWHPLAQLVSITGIWGVTFLAAWFASIGNWIWDSRRRAALFAGIGYGALALAVLGYGTVRIRQMLPSTSTVRVASIVLPDPARWRLANGAELYHDYFNGRSSRGGQIALQRVTRHTQDYLFNQSAAAAHAGAHIIFWAEANARVLASDEASMIQRGRQFARRNGVYLGMAVLVLHPRLSHPDENKIILVTPAGKVAWQYEKAHPLAAEAYSLVSGSDEVPVLDTPYGRLAAMICYDSDFIRFARQTGAAGADLLFVPSNDWRGIAEMRARITRYRAIENGVTLVRPTSHGISEIVAADGRPVAKRDFYADGQPVLLADVPIHGARTMYARIGDWFAWCCIAGFAALSGAVVAGQRRRRSRHIGEAA